MGRKPSTAPVATIKRGNVKIEIRQYGARFGFSYLREGKLLRVRLGSLIAATDRAKSIARILDAGRVDLLAVEPLELAEFRAWRAQKGCSAQLRTVVEQFIASKSDPNLNRDYVRNLAAVLRRLAEKLDCPIRDVTAAQIEGFISGKSARNRNNQLATIVALFRFAREREFLPDRRTVAERVKRVKIRRDERDIAVLTPAELRELLEAARPEYLPWLCFCAFAGIRTEEVSPKSVKSPLRWSDVRWEERTISIRGATSKTGKPRNVPLHPTLAAWLAPWRHASGDVLPWPRKYTNEVAYLKLHGARWEKNALRHTAISCRLALVKNAAQVAEEFGTSVAMIRATYHNPRTEAEARAWFAVLPERAVNVVDMTPQVTASVGK